MSWQVCLQLCMPTGGVVHLWHGQPAMAPAGMADAAALRQALGILTRLGARPPAQITEQRLRAVAAMPALAGQLCPIGAGQ